MYDDPKNIKQVTFKTLFDEYEAQEIKEVIALSKLQKSQFVRQAIRNQVKQFHAINSIGREPKQKELLIDQLTA